MPNRKVRDVINAVKTITEYLEDMGVFFMSDLTDDNIAEMMLITELSHSDVKYIIQYLFREVESND